MPVPTTRSLLSLGAAVTLLAAGACSSGEKSSKAVRSDAVIRVGVTDPLATVNPFSTFSTIGYAIHKYTYPSLVEYDSQSRPAPNWAVDWKASEDGLTWTFQVKPGKWSDGQALTAKDGAFTLATILKYKSGPTGTYASNIIGLSSVSAPDDSTLVLRYAKPSATVLFGMSQIPILPAHVWSKFATGDGKKLASATVSAPVVSGGPMKIAKFTPNSSIVMERYDGFYGKQPNASRLGIRQYSSEDAAVTALKAGEIDVINSVSPTAVAALKSDKSITVHQTKSNTLRDLIFNSSKHQKTHRELQDPKVREAFDKAIDRKKIVSTAYLGYADVGTALVPPSNGEWHDSSIQATELDIAGANALLDSLGYALDSSGTRIAHGEPMSYKIIMPSYSRGTGDRAFAVMKSGLAEIGVKVELQVLDSSAAFDAIKGSDGKYSDFDLAFYDWQSPPDPDFIVSVLTCAQLGNFNDTGNCSKEYDALYHQQVTSESETARKNAIHQIQAYVARTRPYLVLTYDQTITAHSVKVSGLEMGPAGPFSAWSDASLLNATVKG